jgi:hypothetical protein
MGVLSIMRAATRLLLLSKPELVASFTVGVDWSWTALVLTGLGTAGGTDATGNTRLVAGRKYRLRYTMNSVSGLFQVRAGNTFINTDGGASASAQREYFFFATNTLPLVFTDGSSWSGTLSATSLRVA